MKAIMVMFDTLCRHFLAPYGNSWVHTPNFTRLAQRAAMFDNSYVCSMPCMPARRDLHTGRPNFLHRSWGPLEPFDDSIFNMLNHKGVHTHLSTDHAHYFEDGGATYHNQYSTWEFFRGQEADPWIGMIGHPSTPEKMTGRNALHADEEAFARYRNLFPTESEESMQWLKNASRQDWINRQHMPTEADQPQAKAFQAGLDFIDRNVDEDNWLLHIETFDPHEPFFTHDEYKALYAEHYESYRGAFFDWPIYEKVRATPDEVTHLRYEYAALVSMCDAYLGKVMDRMDAHDMWDDTMLIVWTDHGFLLGEHDWWGKCNMPFYQEIAHSPFFVWDPRSQVKGERRGALVQPSIDLGPTLLALFDVEPTEHMLGHDLAATIADDSSVRETAIFGLHGSHVNVTDGRYVYMRGPAGSQNAPLYQYTLMPTHMRAFFNVEDFATMSLAPPFSFMKGCQTMKIQNGAWRTRDRLFENLLWDIETDPQQVAPITNETVEARLTNALVAEMARCDAPAEQYERLALPLPA